LQMTMVGAGVTTRTWTVAMPLAAGSYEFRLFINNVKAATSPAVLVDSSLNPQPSITSLSPATVYSSSGPFTLTVNGSGFTSSSVVQWNGAARPTTFLSGSQLQAAISGADVASPGSAQVKVFTPAPGGGSSESLTLTIVLGPTLTVN